jgi:uncharacterized protein
MEDRSMNNKIKRYASFAALLLGCLLLTPSAQGVSFDCGKVGTKVERIICDDLEISKLDDELNAAYKAVLQDEKQADLFRLTQKQWLKKRNDCFDVDCVKLAYRERISKLASTKNTAGAQTQARATLQVVKKQSANPDLSNTESYTLVMSKDDELCNHMLQLFNEDLKKYGWNGDAHHEEHEEFKRVPWKTAQFSSVIDGRVEYTDIEGALFDFNNDGVQDFVVRWKSWLSNARADLVFMLGSETEERLADLDSMELGAAKNRIYLAGWWYDLSPQFGSIAGVQVLEPFIYHGTSYLVMRPLFEERRTKFGYSAITKYGGGKFINRELTGKMEDICYFKRSRELAYFDKGE